MGSNDRIHLAPLIASKAQVETLETYETRIHHYEDQKFTYIPMPRDGKYYNTEEGWTQPLKESQYISPKTHLLEVLEKLQQEPFLLIDADHNKFVIVKEKTNESVLVKSASDKIGRISSEEFLKDLDFESYDFSEDEVTIYRLDEFLNSDLELKPRQENLVTDYDERWQIITLADVNSRRMKDMLYQRFADLAAGLGKKIEEEYPEPDSILQYISPHAIGRWKKDQLRGLNLHISEHLNLIDMMQVIQASDKEFVTYSGFESKNDVQTLSKINDVRNSVMHANRSLVYNRQDLKKVLKAVEEADRIIENME